MSYRKTQWEVEDVVTSERLNKIEGGIMRARHERIDWEIDEDVTYIAPDGCHLHIDILSIYDSSSEYVCITPSRSEYFLQGDNYLGFSTRDEIRFTLSISGGIRFNLEDLLRVTCGDFDERTLDDYRITVEPFAMMIIHPNGDVTTTCNLTGEIDLSEQGIWSMEPVDCILTITRIGNYGPVLRFVGPVVIKEEQD